MAFSISGYVDPGVYIQETVVPGQVSVTTVPLTVSLVGIANRNARVSNEALLRGRVVGETLTVSSTPGAHDATLVNVSDRKTGNLTVFKDGLALDSAQVSFKPATLTGAAVATHDFTLTTTAPSFALSFDGKAPMTMTITTGGADLTTITGSFITQRVLGLTIAAVTTAQVADAINKAFGSVLNTTYGTAYASVAAAVGSTVVLTSPTSGSASDVQVLTGFPVATSKSATIFTSSPRQAASVVHITDASWASLSVFTANYVSTTVATDTLANANVQTMVRVGALAGVTTYVENTDFTRSSSTLSWSAAAAPVFTSSVALATFDLSTNDTIVLALDGRAAVTIDLNGMASPPSGYTNPVSAVATTLAEIVNNINAVLAASASYGPKYAAVASTAALKVVLTSPTVGVGGYVQVAAPPSVSASTTIFGLSAGQMPYTLAGTGRVPVSGAIYFATYEYTRLTSQYNLAKQYFTPDSLYGDLGFPTSTNQLAIAGGVAFDNGAPSVICTQVNDATFNGAPVQSEIQAALVSLENVSAASDVVVLSTALPTQVDLMNHVVNMSSPTIKNFRRGWFSMPRNTAIGDRDTADSFIYRAVRTLQVPSDSPGRGRLILVAPTNVARTVTREDGSSSDVSLDGTYLAVAIAARMTAFTSPADTLLRKNVSGFVAATFPTYLKTERALLASNGVTVVTLDAGRLVLLDPMTTEAGGGRLIQFQEISASTQKDAVTTAMTQAVDSNLVGVVPSDLGSFVVTIKGMIGGVLRSMISTGAIGPFKTADGLTRDVDFSADIQVFQDATDPTKYMFRYFYNLRYPAKRFFGTYTVDNPFVTT